MNATDLHTHILQRYQNLLHERLVSRRASEDYLYWVRRFLNERHTPDAMPDTGEVARFLRTLKTDRLSSSAERRAEVALELLQVELMDPSEVA
ncbi:hypothetical protein GH975_08915 [Litorivicinus lipolyticus]|uniref:Integrase n=1 Tax=Litorivicinus lipolyticus TaxID=418701 RepID=A0A5Q2QE87_9GAMM|nr:hypothetical protein [Litorivicinus lipolyticus]QGG80681.1 hypothetical protein GH975_08915 [Litorivicinus lipolyticus]